MDPIEVVAACIDAAATDEAWPLALQRLGELAGGTMAQLFVWDNRASRQLESRSWNVSPDSDRLYRTHYSAFDPRRQAVATWPVGELFVCADHFDAAARRRDPFWQEFLIPAGGGFVTGLRLTEDARRLEVLSVHHPQARGPMSAAGRKFLAAIAPHLARACAVHRRLAPLRERGVAAEAALDLVAGPAVVVEADGRVVLANRAAEALLARGDGMAVSGGRITATEPRAAAVLRWAIGNATRGDSPLGRALPVPRRGVATPLHRQGDPCRRPKPPYPWPS